MVLTQWLRRIRGAVVVGLTWAVGWGLVGLKAVTDSMICRFPGSACWGR